MLEECCSYTVCSWVRLCLPIYRIFTSCVRKISISTTMHSSMSLRWGRPALLGKRLAGVWMCLAGSLLRIGYILLSWSVTGCTIWLSINARRFIWKVKPSLIWLFSMPLSYSGYWIAKEPICWKSIGGGIKMISRKGRFTNIVYMLSLIYSHKHTQTKEIPVHKATTVCRSFYLQFLN